MYDRNWIECVFGNLYNVAAYTNDVATGVVPTVEYSDIQRLSVKASLDITSLLADYETKMIPEAKMPTDSIQYIVDTLVRINETDFDYTVPTLNDPKIK